MKEAYAIALAEHLKRWNRRRFSDEQDDIHAQADPFCKLDYI